MGGFSLLHAAGDAETGELPKGTALCIAEAIPEEYSPEELITNTYHEDMLSDLGIDKTGEILDFNFAARSLTAINERYPMECVRRVTDQLIYAVYRIEGEGKEFNAYYIEQPYQGIYDKRNTGRKSSVRGGEDDSCRSMY